VRFLIDNAVSPLVARGLRELGHDAVHVRDVGLRDASDETVFARAAEENRAIVSSDTDFGTLLALSNARKPSVLLFRHAAPRNPRLQVGVLKANLPQLTEDLETESIVAPDGARIRVRRLPVGDRD